MIGTFGVEDQPVGAIDGNDRAILAKCPERQAFQCRGVRSQIRVDHHEVGDKRLRLAGGHADAQAKFEGLRLDGRKPAPGAGFGDNDKRLVSRRAVPTGAPDAIRWQIGKEDRYGPGHHRLLIRTRHTRPL